MFSHSLTPFSFPSKVFRHSIMPQMASLGHCTCRYRWRISLLAQSGGNRNPDRDLNAIDCRQLPPRKTSLYPTRQTRPALYHVGNAAPRSLQSRVLHPAIRPYSNIPVPVSRNSSYQHLERFRRNRARGGGLGSRVCTLLSSIPMHSGTC